jgi:hypothetical protein
MQKTTPAALPAPEKKSTDEAPAKSLSVLANSGGCDADIAGIVESNLVSEATFLAMGLAYLNRGARNLEAARDMGAELRKQYENTAKRHRNVRLAALTAETVLMAYYGYGAIEHYTGMKEGIGAAAANSAISGGISATRAGVQYGLMKRSEECFEDGEKSRGMMFMGIGLSLAVINSLFVAIGFANKYVVQEQGHAAEALSKLSAEEAKVHAAKTAATEQLNREIAELDKKIGAIRSGASDPRISAIEEQSKRLSAEVDGIRNHPNFNDGKETEWDRAARRDMASKEAQIEKLGQDKNTLLMQAGTNLTPDQQQMLDANMRQRLALNEQVRDLDKRFKPQLDDLANSRKLFETRLSSVSNNAEGFAALGNMTILIESMANVAAISVANWYAAQVGHKEDVVRGILAGDAPKDPWAKKGAQSPGTPTPEFNKSAPAQPPSAEQVFMGYDCGAGALAHMRNEQQLNAMSKVLGNAEAMRSELRAEVTRQYGKMVKMLHENRDTLAADEYAGRLSAVGGAYKNALDVLADDEILIEISKIMTDKPEAPKKPLTGEVNIPVFENPDDPKYKTLPSGRQFKTPDGQIRVKL